MSKTKIFSIKSLALILYFDNIKKKIVLIIYQKKNLVRSRIYDFIKK